MALHFDNPCSKYPTLQDAEVWFPTEEHQTLRKTIRSLNEKCVSDYRRRVRRITAVISTVDSQIVI
jgi:hypothetical protein